MAVQVVLSGECSGAHYLANPQAHRNFIKSSAVLRLGHYLRRRGNTVLQVHHFSSFSIDELRGFLAFIGYDKMKCIFNVQFLVNNSKFYIMDFNTRTGPISCQLELYCLMDPRVYKLVPFLAGDKTAEECVGNKPIERYRNYAEFQGKTVTSRVFYKNPKRVIVSENKTSGIVRNDYEVYIEKFLDYPEE